VVLAGKLYIVHMDGRSRAAACGEHYVTDLKALTCIRHFWSQSWIARRWVWSFWEVTAGSLSVARTAVSSANVAMVVDDREFCHKTTRMFPVTTSFPL
jgi:hypothetical protein